MVAGLHSLGEVKITLLAEFSFVQVATALLAVNQAPSQLHGGLPSSLLHGPLRPSHPMAAYLFRTRGELLQSAQIVLENVT